MRSQPETSRSASRIYAAVQSRVCATDSPKRRDRMPTKMHDDFVAPRRRRTGPMSVHYETLAADPGGWYRFSRREVGHCTESFQSCLHSGARTRGLKSHTQVDADVVGGVIACFYDPDAEEE